MRRIARKLVGWRKFVAMSLFVFGCSAGAVVAPQGTAKTFVFECRDDYQFVASVEQEKVWLFLPGQSIALPVVASAVGSKFQADDWLLSVDGDEATLQFGENSYAGCVNNRQLAIWEDAKLRGVDFRAVGNEPGWWLEISQQNRLYFSYDYGQQELTVEVSGPVEYPALRQSHYRGETGQGAVRVVLEGAVCQDSMADESYETRVRITLGERLFQGCGKALH